MSDAVLVALISTIGVVIVGGLPLLSYLIKRQVDKGAVKVSTLNTEEHLANARKLDTIVTTLGFHGETLGRVEGTVLRQSEVLADHLSWHLHSPLVSDPPKKDHAA